jgi:alpha-L-arabinofuranosidase
MPLSREESLLSGVYAGLMMNQFERNGDLIDSSAVSDMVNGWMGGIIQSAKDGRLYVTPTYLVNRLYNEHLGDVRVFSDVSSAGAYTLGGSGNLDAVVSKGRSGKEMIFKLVNRSGSETNTVRVHVNGVTLGAAGRMATITGASLDSINTFDDPQNVREVDGQVVTGTQFTVTIPKASVSVLTVPIR